VIMPAVGVPYFDLALKHFGRYPCSAVNKDALLVVNKSSKP